MIEFNDHLTAGQVPCLDVEPGTVIYYVTGGPKRVVRKVCDDTTHRFLLPWVETTMECHEIVAWEYFRGDTAPDGHELHTMTTEDRFAMALVVRSEVPQYLQDILDKVAALGGIFIDDGVKTHEGESYTYRVEWLSEGPLLDLFTLMEDNDIRYHHMNVRGGYEGLWRTLFFRKEKTLTELPGVPALA